MDRTGSPISRRRLLGLVGGGAVAAGTGGGVLVGRASAGASGEPDPTSLVFGFHGPHQAGIVTPAQDRLHFAAFDVTASSRDDLITLLRRRTVAADRMVRGLGAGPFGPAGGPYQAPPDDTGEALGLPPAGLTLTFGVGAARSSPPPTAPTASASPAGGPGP